MMKFFKSLWLNVFGPKKSPETEYDKAIKAIDSRGEEFKKGAIAGFKRLPHPPTSSFLFSAGYEYGELLCEQIKTSKPDLYAKLLTEK